MAFKLYQYAPSLVAAVIFIVLFTASTLLHIYQMVKTRTRFLLALCCGGIFEVVGYAGRIKSATESGIPKYSLPPYLVQTILLLVAPTLFAASIYMELGRIAAMVEGDAYLLVRRRWLTRVFVCGDILSFIMQASGGGMMALKTDKARKTGSNIVVGGLFIQIVFFGCFVAVALLFHSRLRNRPTRRVTTEQIPYLRHLTALYATSILIFVRSIVRVIEFIQGFDGYVISHEYFLYIFDSVPMFLVLLVMNWIHPSEITSLLQGGLMSKGFRMVQYSDRSRSFHDRNRDNN